MTLPERLKMARKVAGLGQMDVAKQLIKPAADGTFRYQTVSEWERGKREPTAKELGAICNLYQVDGHWLVTGEGDLSLQTRGDLSVLAVHLADQMNEPVAERVWLGLLYAFGAEMGWPADRMDWINKRRREAEVQVASRVSRIDLEMPVELSFDDSEKVFLGHSVNISITGMLVLSEEARPRGTLVRFEFGLRLKGLSEIIWTREAEQGGTFLGMKFHPLERSARNVLQGLMGKLSRA